MKLGLDENLRGKGVMGGFEELQAMSPEKRKKFLGESIELNSVYQALEQDADKVRARQKEVAAGVAATGTSGSPLMIGSQAFLADEQNAAVFGRNVARERRELAKEKELGVKGMQIEAAKDSVRAKLTADGTWGVNRGIAEASMWVADAFSDDPRAIRSAGISGGRGGGTAYLGGAGNPFADGAWVKKQMEAAEDLAAAAADLKDSAKSRTAAQRAEAAVNRE
jgi:hypothetical protein